MLFEVEEVPERFTLTYASDVKLEIPGTLSVESPLGKSLLGKQQVGRVEYTLNIDGRELQKKAQILEIIPGSLGTIE